MFLFFLFYHSGNRAALKGLLVSTVLVSFSQFTATTALVVYAVIIFKKFRMFTNVFVAPIILSVIVTFGSLTSSYLADKLGRRLLNCLSLLLTACGLLVTALFYYLNLHHHDLVSCAWIPVFSLFFSVYAASAGINAMGLICSVENLPTKVCVE